MTLITRILGMSTLVVCMGMHAADATKDATKAHQKEAVKANVSAVGQLLADFELTTKEEDAIYHQFFGAVRANNVDALLATIKDVNKLKCTVNVGVVFPEENEVLNDSALMIAARKGHKEIVATLIRIGADLAWQNYKGQDVFAVATVDINEISAKLKAQAEQEDAARNARKKNRKNRWS